MNRKHTKRFIIISLLLATSLHTMACAWIDTHNNYLFSPYDTTTFSERADQLTCDNWKAYLGTGEEYFYFDAEEIIKAAQRKGDSLMASYVRNLQQYLDCAQQKRNESWDYPTKKQLAERRQTLQKVRLYAKGKLGTKLRSQHALLYMRCNMMLGNHGENVSFWQQTASKYIETVYKDMMLNIYAGAMLQTGHGDEASRIFAAQGDWESLMTQYYKRRSCQAIREEYQRHPDSPVLPFLLKDFVNNAQEAIDSSIEEGGGLPGKLFIRNITKAEARQMCQLAAQAVSEGKTTTPVLWQSAKAWLEFMDGDKKQALDDITAALTMDGTERMKDNARVLKLYITAAQAEVSPGFNDFLAGELQWLDSKAADGNFFMAARDRLVHQVLAPKYDSDPVMAVALLRATDCSLYQGYIDTMRVERLQQYLEFACPATSGNTSLAKNNQSSILNYLKERQHVETDRMTDLVGTKYLRLCKWQEAIDWLSRVPVSYYDDQGYAIYASKRKWTVEPWITRQWLKSGEEYDHPAVRLPANPKLSFAKDMQQAEAQLALLTGKARLQQCYELAVRYAQAHYTGDCWFLMRDGKSTGDTLRTNEVHLGMKALELLRQACQADDHALREKALFAQCYSGFFPTPWYDREWNSSTCSYDRHPNAQSQQYKAFQTLARFERDATAPVANYVSRCDEYKQFSKHYR